MNEWLILGWIFLAVGGLAFLVLNRLLRPRDRALERLEEGDGELRHEPLLGEWTEPLAAQLPATAEAKADLDRALRAAGYYQPTAAANYRAVRTLLVVLPLLLGGVWTLLDR